MKIADVWQTAFSPPDRRSIERWALDNISLPPVLRRRRFTTDDTRHFIAPLAALRHNRVRGVRILKPVRGGGTLIADVFAPWAIKVLNASILWIFQDQGIAESHAETRQMPILESVPGIKEILPRDRHKKRKADILFETGLPFQMQGPALGGLQARGFMVVICDEAWLYKQGVLTEAKGRMGDFVKNASNKFLGISQGGEDDSEWEMECKEGVLFVWMPRCSGCREIMPIEWTIRKSDNTIAGAKWDSIKNPDGSYDKDRTAATVRYLCPKCGHAHAPGAKTWAEWNASGWYYRPETLEPFDEKNPPTECTFRWHALIDYPWFDLVKYWLSAQEAKRVGNFAPLVAFFQKRCALFRSERTIHEGDLPFARISMVGLDPKLKAWPEENARFMTADRQSEDVYWVTVRAWSKTGESRRLWFGRLYSEVDLEAKRDEFAVPCDCTVVDSGYRPKGDHGVYAACIKYGWVAAKGTDDGYFWHTEQREGGTTARVQKPWAPLSWGDPGEGTSNEGRTRCPLIRFSAPSMADRVLGLIERGLWVEPDADENSEIEKEYKAQMTAEFKRPRENKFTGHREMVYVCPSGNNHAFDDAKMQVLCAMQTGHLPAGIEFQKRESEPLKPLSA